MVAYFRDRYCVFAPDGVRLLRTRGLSPRPLEEGPPDWCYGSGLWVRLSSRALVMHRSGLA
jgi:hypothetical protein